MGCDIHVCIEALQDINGKNIWVNVDNWRVNPYNKNNKTTEYVIERIFTDRNYELFTMLSGVRNDGGNQTLGFNRGLPSNISKESKNSYLEYSGYSHTPSYCNLRELKYASLKYLTIERCGWVTNAIIDQYYTNNIKPNSWYKDVFPKEGYTYLEWEDKCDCFDRLIEVLNERKRDVFNIYSFLPDNVTYDDKIRIVFWYDN